jgi:sulfite reductase (NADPH) flavoprotein alpha-component
VREHGYRIYVVGDVKRMAKDVGHALREIIAHHGQLEPEQVAVQVKKLVAEKRYVRDVC